MNSLYRFVFSLLFFFIFLASNAQTASWWENNVNWDGRTHWSRYIIIAPKYLGPNALSVPHINNGSIDSLASLGLTAHFHFSRGDNTQNLVLSGNYTTKNNTISIEGQFIPHERFQLSHQIKTERKTFYLDYNKTSVTGDVVANTTVQLFPKKREKVQVALRLGIRMPSGGGLTMARYGDVPAYWVDAGVGLPFRNKHWKLLMNLGIFIWQINQDNHRQDDAFLFASGIEWNRETFKAQAYVAGYSGYLNNGDRPVVARLNWEKKNRKRIYLLRLQQGLQDFKYSSVEAGARLILSK